jgi:hypothetical protein
MRFDSSDKKHEARVKKCQKVETLNTVMDKKSVEENYYISREHREESTRRMTRLSYFSSSTLLVV